MMDRYVDGFMDGLSAAENLLRTQGPNSKRAADDILDYIDGSVIVHGKTAAQLAIANAEARIISMPPPRNVDNHEHV